MAVSAERALELDDIPDLPQGSSAAAITTTLDRCMAAQDRTPGFLRRVLMQGFGWRFYVGLCFSSAFACCLVAAPQMVKNLLQWLENPTEEYVGYLWAVGLYGCFFVVSSCVTHMYVTNTLMGIEMRSAVMLAVFRKVYIHPEPEPKPEPDRKLIGRPLNFLRKGSTKPDLVQ